MNILSTLQKLAKEKRERLTKWLNRHYIGKYYYQKEMFEDYIHLRTGKYTFQTIAWNEHSQYLGSKGHTCTLKRIGRNYYRPSPDTPPKDLHYDIRLEVFPEFGHNFYEITKKEVNLIMFGTEEKKYKYPLRNQHWRG